MLPDKFDGIAVSGLMNFFGVPFLDVPQVAFQKPDWPCLTTDDPGGFLR
ncbi:hypothetical protein ACSSZE_13760 [Acidithiobacillus caldus]